MKKTIQIGTLTALLALSACSSDDAGSSDDGDSSFVGDAGDGDGSYGAAPDTAAGAGATSGTAYASAAGGAAANGQGLSYASSGGSSSGAGGSSGVSAPSDQNGDEEELAAGGAAPELWPATNPFVVVDYDPLSTFAADVDTASYDLFRAYVGGGSLPDPSGVRLEEFVNYFEYDYPQPALDSQHPFAIHLSAAPNLVSRDTQILRVGIQGRNAAENAEKKPANLVFLVDSSGSMGGQWSVLQSTLRQTVDLLDADDTIAIVTYAGSSATLLSATKVSNKESILAAIDSMTTNGGTNGAGGINAAYAEAEGAFIEDGINHIIICTDGDFNVGVTSIDELEKLIVLKRKSGVTLTALAFGTTGVNDAMLERVSNAGNGIYGYIASEADAEKYVRERMLQTLVHIAKDMKIQVEFNPEHVYAYRLLGYENRAIADVDFRNDIVDAGEIGSGHRVTALYELVLNQGDLPQNSEAPSPEDGSLFDGESEVSAADLVLVKVRYKSPQATEEDPATEVSSTLTLDEVMEGLEGAGSDLQWAVAVASFAEVLKGSPYADTAALDSIRLILDAQKGVDEDRAEFLQLFDVALNQIAP